METRVLFMAVVTLLAGCVTTWTTSHVPETTSAGGWRVLERDVEGVGRVTERILSRGPGAHARGDCAGRVELSIPGGQGGSQWWEAEVGCPGGESRVQAVARVPGERRNWVYAPTLDQMARARGMALTGREPTVTWIVPDTAYAARSWTAVVHAVGSRPEPILNVAWEQEADARQVVLAMGSHHGDPGPGARWDDVQVSLLDGRGRPISSLVMDNRDVGAHAGLVLNRGEDGRVTEVGYVGLLRDETGTWRFVDVWLPVRGRMADPPKGLALIPEVALASQDVEVLATRGGRGGPGHLWVDGASWFEPRDLAGVVEVSTHRVAAPMGTDTVVNGSPPQAPRWLLASAPRGEVRLATDRTFAGDTRGLLLRVPAAARRGWSHTDDVMDREGRRVAAADALRADGDSSLSSRGMDVVVWGGRKVRVERSLVAVPHGDGMHYGLRQTLEWAR